MDVFDKRYLAAALRVLLDGVEEDNSEYVKTMQTLEQMFGTKFTDVARKYAEEILD